MEKDGLTPAKATHKKHWLVGGVGLLIVIGLISGFLIWRWSLSSVSLLPNNLSQQVPFPIYIPRELPGNYHLAEDSFSYNEGVLVFQAKDASGASIAFTEQQ